MAEKRAAGNVADPKTDYATDYIKGDWDKAQYLPDPHVDNLQACVLALGTEFWVMRRRQLITESLVGQNKQPNRAAIDAYRPTEAETAAWNVERDDMIDRVYAVLTRVKAPAKGAPPMSKVAPLGKQNRT